MLHLLYLSVGLLWAIFATVKQFGLFGSTPWWKVLICFILNWIWWPVAIVLAVVRYL